MKVDRAIQLFKSLICPIAQYASEFWSILTLPVKSFETKNDLMRAWENFVPETLNQRFCRLLLSVHKKTSRLAVLGELGHYPLLVQSFIQTIKYKWSLNSTNNCNSLVHDTLSEMSGYADSGQDCWLARVRKLEKLFSIPSLRNYVKKEAVGKVAQKRVKSVFDRFWLDEVNREKLVNGINTNKLRFYTNLKSCFSREPYIDLVQSRNQRSFLTRIRCSAHNLEIEKLRYKKPSIPPASRICNFCTSGQIGDEFHFLMNCDIFNVKRACFIGKMNSLIPGFTVMSQMDKLKTILCPKSSAAVKVVNKFIRIMFLARDNITEGLGISTYPTMPANIYPCNADSDIFSDCDEWEESLAEQNLSEYEND